VKLNAYSQRFAERLLAVHPEWRPLARSDPEGFPPPGSLLVEVASLVPGRELWVRTYGDQVTIDFGEHGWHENFGHPGATEEAVFAKALAFIEDLLSDRLLVVTRIFLGRPFWTRAVEATAFKHGTRPSCSM
jgi:hypothetical protein